MARFEDRHLLLCHVVLISILIIVELDNCSPTTVSIDDEHRFTSCTNRFGKNYSDFWQEPCECSALFPIVLDDRICLPVRQYNQTCVLTEQCLKTGINGSFGCFRNGVNLLQDSDGAKQLVEVLSEVKPMSAVRARCRCAPNHYYHRERRICLCKTNSTNNKCRTKSWHLITDQEFNSTRIHFAETIVFWIILTLILTLIFMVLTICRKCFCAHNSNVEYRTVRTTTTTTLIDMTLINNTNDRLNRLDSIALNEDRPPTYEEAIRAQA